MPLNVLAFLCALLFIAAPLQAQRAVGEVAAAAIEVPRASPDLAESLQTLRDTLRRVSSKRDLDAQYGLFLEAERLLDAVGARISPNEIRDLREKMQRAFSRLQLPIDVANQYQLTFRRLKVGREMAYMSVAVVEGLFVTFLNDRAVAPKLFAKWVPIEGHGISYENGSYISRQPTRPMLGVTWYATSAFSRWMSDRGLYRMPSAGLVTVLKKSRISCWAEESWKPSDYRRDELLRMFGGKFQTLVIDGKPLGELPEAGYANVTMRYVVPIPLAKHMYLKTLRDASVE